MQEGSKEFSFLVVGVMKAPCKKICWIISKCKDPENCPYWKEYVRKSKTERENRK